MNNEKYNLTDFNEQMPNDGHQLRFEERLNRELHKKKASWPRFAVAASIILLLSIGFYQWSGNSSTPLVAEQTEEDNNEFPLKEAENYYENSFEMQYAVISDAYKGPESKQMIKESMLLIEELQSEYKDLEKQLKETGDQRVATAMILNYKSRISILEELLKQLEYVNLLLNQKDEKVNA
tara:strand:- start:594 stop:1133 length:540 start_codon:yes stop_codon:yes gene_type:complete